MPEVIDIPSSEDVTAAAVDEATRAPVLDANLEEQLRKDMLVQLGDVTSGVVAEKADSADEYLREQTSQRGFKGFLKKIWVGNIARDFIRQKHMRQTEREIVTSRNLYVSSGGSQDQHNKAMESVINRFANEYGNQMLHSGETNEAASAKEGGAELETQVKDLIGRFARGLLTDEALREEKTRLVDHFGNLQHSKDRNKGLLYADNIIKVAQNAKAAFKHEDGIDNLDAILNAVNVKVADVRIGARTAASKEAIDRLADKVHARFGGNSGDNFERAAKAGRNFLVNETVVTSAAAIALGVSKFTVRKLITAAGATVGMGVGAGLIAGYRESRNIKQERRLHARQMAEGGEIDTGHNSKRRQQVEETRYQTESADVLLENLRNASTEHEEVRGLGGLTRLLGAATEAQTRIRMSDDLNADLITFRDKTTIEQQRLELDIALATAKVKLQRFIDGASDQDLQNLGIERLSIDEVITHQSDNIRRAIEGDMSAKDKAFRHLQAKRVISHAAIGMAMGITIGAASQEIHAELSNGLRGVFENSHAGQDRRTELAAFFHEKSTNPSQMPHSNFDHSSFKLGNDALDLPKGYSVHHDVASGVNSIIGPNGKTVAHNINFDNDGHLDAASIHTLQKEGFALHVTNEAFKYSTTTNHTAEVDPQNYIAAHPNSFTSVQRGPWYDNNTPHVFDQNELKLDWGGVNGTGLDGQGHYVFNVSQMTADGSYHGAFSADAQQLIAEHKLAIAVSLDQATQNHVILIPIDAGGNGFIDPSNPALQSVFTTENGQAHFIGGYAECVQLTGTNAQGEQTMRMLATVVGNNQPHHITEVVPQLVQHSGEHVITHIEAPQNLPTEVTPVVSVHSRRGMENLRREITPRNPNGMPLYYGGRGLEELRAWIAEDPSRLHPRREVTNPDGTKSWVEADGAPVVRSVERERATIKAYLDEERANNSRHYALVERIAAAMKPMHKETRLSVNVPAWMERDNLAHFLDEYTKQVDKEGARLRPELYEINILVNRKSGTPADDSVKVINDFITDFERRNGFKPNVNYYDVELDPPFNNVGYARKLLTDVVVQRSLQRTEQAAPLYIESEDADMVKIDPHNVFNLISKFDANPHFDALRGVQDRVTNELKDNDMLLLRQRGGNFFEMLARAKRLRDPSKPNWDFVWNRVVTGGWNTGYTAEAYGLMRGYGAMMLLGEDMSVGEKITMIRGDGNLPNLEVVGRVYSRSISSPRRFINELQTGKGAYDDFTNEETNQEIRDKPIEDAVRSVQKYSRINETNTEEFNGYINGLYSMVKASTPSDDEARAMMRRLLFWLGFKKDDYAIEGDNQVTIRSWDNVKIALDRYRTRSSVGA